MCELNLPRMNLSNHCAPSSKIKNLLIELFEICPALMINIGVRNESDFKTCFLHSDAELNIFCITGKFESLRFLKYLSRYTHVETPWLKPTHSFFASPDSTRG